MNDNDNANTLQELVQLARDGAEFYGAAAKHVQDPTLLALFERMAKGKRDLITALGGRLEMIGESTPDGGTFAGSVRQVYAEALAGLSANDGKVYVDQLEQSEDRMLANFKQAVERTTNPEILSQLKAHLPAIQAGHDEMRRWKRTLAAA